MIIRPPRYETRGLQSKAIKFIINLEVHASERTAVESYFRASITNVYRHGDTDIFPFPVENRVFFDEIDSTTEILVAIYEKFTEYFSSMPPYNIRAATPVHHFGFRWATQIDSIWNNVLLGCVISIAELIEKIRLSDDYVFSYRLCKDTYLEGDLFRKDVSWRDYISNSIDAAKASSFIVVTDISDCYARFSHHKLDNYLRAIGSPARTRRIILCILAYLSHRRSSGLPVGGPAARILAELCLNSSDRFLHDNGYRFFRYADDYHIFCADRASAYRAIVDLSTALDNEGLSLQRSKTRILTPSEFISMSESMLGRDKSTDSPVQKLMSISLRYDPYSMTAEEDYDFLQSELDKIDVISLLNEQLAQSRIHIATTKKIIAALSFIEEKAVYGAVASLLNNMNVLHPIAANVFIIIEKIFERMSEREKLEVCRKIRELHDQNHEVMAIILHVAYSIRIIGSIESSDNTKFLSLLYTNYDNPIIRREIIRIFANWANFNWLSMHKEAFDASSAWERRMHIIASYALHDEGSHWRQSAKGRFNVVESLIRDWASQRAQKGSPSI